MSRTLSDLLALRGLSTCNRKRRLISLLCLANVQLIKKAGDVKRIVMGLDRNLTTPCGFCFVIYYTRADAEACVRFVNETFLDDRLIRVDIDWGFQEGRQYGRGKSGGQVRDERRTDYDEGRGGFGKLMQQEMSVPGN